MIPTVKWHKIGLLAAYCIKRRGTLIPISTFRFHLNRTELQELFLDELRKQNWFNISVSSVLSEELILSIQ